MGHWKFDKRGKIQSWYNLVVKDLEQGILARIQQIEEELPQLHRTSENGTAILVHPYPSIPSNPYNIQTGSFILFGDSHPIHQGYWASFLDDSLECIFNEIRNASLQMLKEFQANLPPETLSTPFFAEGNV